MNNRFNSIIKQLVVPIRFSILALLSARKCTVFDDSLISLMEYIKDQRFEDVSIYKLAEIGSVFADLSSSSSSSSHSESDEESKSAAPEEKVKKMSTPIVDGNEIYLKNSRFL